MAAPKLKKYPDYVIKFDKYKTKLRFSVFCNNLSEASFHRDTLSPKYLTANFYHSYKGIAINSIFTIPAKNLNIFLSGTKFPKTKVRKNGKLYNIEFIIDDTTYAKYLDMGYADIPNQITLSRVYTIKESGVKIEIELISGKKAYTQLIGYHDKTLPKTYKKEKWSPIFYTGISTRPLQGGGVSPR